jgi:hypothetical protein
MPSKKYPLPLFLVGRCEPAAYVRWLDRKARAHVIRDRGRGNVTATREEYMGAIHRAVLASDGRDAYTGAPLAWDLISTYSNEGSRAGRRVYKQTLADLPTVDHVGDGTGAADFVICGWRTNDCKNDLTREELIAFCRAVLAHCDKPGSAPGRNG